MATVGKHAGNPVYELSEACTSVTACLSRREPPCLVMDRAHKGKLILCRDLEHIADSLPDRIDRRLCLIVAAQIITRVKTSHDYEEEHIFPAFVANATIAPGSGLAALHIKTGRLATVRRLKAEHIEDQAAAHDLADMLYRIGHGAPVDNPEAFGFMLRAFFEAMRRHIAFEREHIMPALGQHMPG